MNSLIKSVALIALGIVCATPILATADDRVPPHNVPAKPPVLLKQPAVVATLATPLVAKPPVKPPVFTAIAAKGPHVVDQKSIIFVGGKPRGGSNAELNPQPIPPGHAAPGDPIH